MTGCRWYGANSPASLYPSTQGWPARKPNTSPLALSRTCRRALQYPRRQLASFLRQTAANQKSVSSAWQLQRRMSLRPTMAFLAFWLSGFASTSKPRAPARFGAADWNTLSATIRAQAPAPPARKLATPRFSVELTPASRTASTQRWSISLSAGQKTQTLRQ
jgi:hypothetical protein